MFSGIQVKYHTKSWRIFSISLEFCSLSVSSVGIYIITFPYSGSYPSYTVLGELVSKLLGELHFQSERCHSNLTLIGFMAKCLSQHVFEKRRCRIFEEPSF